MFVDLYTTLRTENKWSVIYVALIHDNFINKKKQEIRKIYFSQRDKKYNLYTLVRIIE